MRVAGVDERMVEGERDAEFLVFIYEGGEDGRYPWSVDSYLLADTDLSGVLLWLRENLPADCCWSLGVVQRPDPRYDGWPLPEGRARVFDVAWIVGGDVLNSEPSSRDADEERLAQAMLARRDSVQF